jgi:hypothetical protein
MKNDLYQITPLGAAIVEALPNRKLVRRIRVNFRRRLICPVSSIFDAEGIQKFYSGKVRAK